MKKFKNGHITIAALILLASVLVNACASSSTPAAPGGNPPADTQTPISAPTATAVPTQVTPVVTAAGLGKQTFIYVSPNPVGVNPYLKLGQTGLEAAGKKYGADTRVLESTDPASREANVKAALSSGATLVIVFGMEFDDIVARIAPQNPDAKFLMIDACIEKPPANVWCATSKEYQAAFLLGIEAALLTQTGRLGAIGATDIPFVHRYTDGFVQGAKYVNADIHVEVRWVGGDNPFYDPVRAKEQALAMASDNVDQILAAASGSNLGIFEAAKEKNIQAYGSDVNQCSVAAGFIVDNLLKHADMEVEQSIDAIMQGSPAHTTEFDLKSGGIGAVAQMGGDLGSTGCLIANHPDVVAKVNEAAARIESGQIKLTDSMNPK